MNTGFNGESFHTPRRRISNKNLILCIVLILLIFFYFPIGILASIALVLIGKIRIHMKYRNPFLIGFGVLAGLTLYDPSTFQMPLSGCFIVFIALQFCRRIQISMK